MILRTIKMVSISAICVLLAQPVLAESSWRKSADRVWKKHVSANQATLRLVLLGKHTYFAITTPCSTKDGSTETYRWASGDVMATNKEPCPDSKHTIKAERVIDLFLPLPTDYDPLKKENGEQSRLTIL